MKLAPVPRRASAPGRATQTASLSIGAPRASPRRTAACLSYSVWLPKDFPFTDGGVLPGIFGTQPDAINEPLKDGSGFGTRISWRRDGEGDLAAKPSGSGYLTLNQRGFPLARGRWMRIEQEIVLNAPGQADGHRQAVGRRRAQGREHRARACARTRTETMSGVLADVGYLRATGSAGSLRISPFEIAWR